MARLSEQLRTALIALRNNPTFRRILAANPTVVRFVAARFSRSELLGLRLTIGIAIGGVFLFLFLAVVQDLLATDPLVQADLRVMSLLQVLRAPTFDRAMLFVTYLGNWQLIYTGALLALIYLALSSRWLSVVALAGSLLGGEALVWVAKYLFARPRPDLANALVVAHGPSFPSGHAFVAFSFYGLVAWLVAERVRTWPRKALVSGVALLGMATLGFSRVYLGVHWPSDVLASFALGAFWLTVVLTSLNIALVLRTELDPDALLVACHFIEAALGRNRAAEIRWGPRFIDIDLIAFGDVSRSEAGLTLPHPRFAERDFVPVPLAEIAASLRTGGRTVADHLVVVGSAGVEKLEWPIPPL